MSGTLLTAALQGTAGGSRAPGERGEEVRNMNRNRMRRGLMLALATAVFGGLSTTTGPSASAAATLQPMVFHNPADGGTYAQLWELHGPTNTLAYQAAFHPYGETLVVWDRLTDGFEAT